MKGRRKTGSKVTGRERGHDMQRGKEEGGDKEREGRKGTERQRGGGEKREKREGGEKEKERRDGREGSLGKGCPLPNRLGGLEERNFGMMHPRDVQPNRRTDGRAIAHSALSIYAICCCALKMIHKCTTSSIQ